MAGEHPRSAPDLTPERVLADAERAWRRRQDIGLSNRALNIFFEPQNPFDPTRRRAPKKDTVVLATLVLFALGAAVYFNLTAILMMP